MAVCVLGVMWLVAGMDAAVLDSILMCILMLLLVVVLRGMTVSVHW